MAISVAGLSKSFSAPILGRRVPVLDCINLEVTEGRIVALFGPNGSGKTTLLNVISGIERAEAGAVSISAEDDHRPVLEYVFQNFRDVLLPWESTLDNMGFGLRARGATRSAARERARCFLDSVGLELPWRNYPYQISVGQQQMVVLARALIQSPSNILLDEPFSALDHEIRFRMQDVVVSTTVAQRLAVLLVSHDIDEALYLGDELILLSKRPGSIVRRFTVPFPRPRTHALLTSTEFSALRREVLSAFLTELRP